MIRARGAEEGENEDEELISMPPEMLVLIAEYVTKECYTVKDFFNYHAAAKFLWAEYYAIGDDTLMQLCMEKKEKNRLSLVKTLLVEYKNNVIHWSHFSSILGNTRIVAARIKEVGDYVLVSDDDDDEEEEEDGGGGVGGVGAQYMTTTEGTYVVELNELSSCGTRKVTVNGHTEYRLLESAMIVLNALAIRVSLRYHWKFFLKSKNPKPQQGDKTPPAPSTKLFLPLPEGTRVNLRNAILYMF